MIDNYTKSEEDAREKNYLSNSLEDYLQESGPTGLSFLLSEIDPEDFEESMKGVVRRHPDLPKLRVIYAKHLMETGKPAAAAEQLKEALNRDESLVEARLFLIQSLAMMAEYERAVKHCESIVSKDPDDPYGNLYMGMLGERLMHPEDSKYLHRAVELAVSEEHSEELFENFASLAGAIGFSSHEQWIYRKWAESQPGNTAPLNQLALMMESYGNLDECVDLYRKSLKVEPDNPWIYLSLAEAYLSKGESEKALQVCRECLEVISKEASEENWVALREISSLMKEIG